jgi:hypothetical protein
VVALDLDAAGFVITAMCSPHRAHPLAPRCRHWCLGWQGCRTPTIEQR